MSDSLYRRWLIDSGEKLSSVLTELAAMRPLVKNKPLVLEIRQKREEKTPAQRALWHAVIGDFAEKLGLSPRETKELIKTEYWGKREKVSTEKLDRVEYGKLIDFTYQYAAERDVFIPDRRAK